MPAILRFLACVTLLGLLASICAAETPAQRDARMRWWREAKFGLFIHWGIYSVPADATDLQGRHAIAEWYFSNKQMQMADYRKFAAQFNPVRFNAREWVRMAKDAGMKYIVITSKHHDGFCMWKTEQNNDWNIVDATPFKRDPLKELAQECRRQGIKLCFYYSIMDWHHPDYLPRRPWEASTRPAQGADFARYIAYMTAQLRELVKGYGPLGVLWFDGEWEPTWTHEHGKDLYAYVRSLQPNILINNRVDKGRQGMQGMTRAGEYRGDFGTPEQEVPATGIPGVDWESCMTMNDTWGYARNDTNWKSTPHLVRTLIDIASKGGNFLLNVGPTAEGLIPAESVQRLAEMGTWMRVNGSSIHGSSASPFRALPFEGRCTAKGSRLYLHVFRWPDEGLKLPGLRNKVVRIRALAGNENLAFTRDNESVLHIQRPSRLDPIATVVELTLDGPPRVQP